MDTMLSKALRDFMSGPLNQLLVNMSGRDPDVWERELKKFNRKEPCWVVEEVKEVVKETINIFTLDMARLPPLPYAWKKVEYNKPRSAKARLEKKDGQLYLDGKVVTLYLDGNQKTGAIGGDELREKLRSKPTGNANLLDFLLKPENQHLIPEDWKSMHVFFWGTIYLDFSSCPKVRCMYWSAGRWHGSSCKWLGDRDWGSWCHSVVCAR